MRDLSSDFDLLLSRILLRFIFFWENGLKRWSNPWIRTTPLGPSGPLCVLRKEMCRSQCPVPRQLASSSVQASLGTKVQSPCRFRNQGPALSTLAMQSKYLRGLGGLRR